MNPIINASDVKIGELIFLHYYEKFTGKTYDDIRNLRTERSSVNLADCVPDIISFKTEQLSKVLEQIKSTTVSGTKGEFSIKIKYGGLEIKLAQGGIHSKDTAVRITPKPGWKLVEKDISGQYPVCIENFKYFPEHLDSRALEEICKRTRIERDEAKISGDKIINAGLKLLRNAFLYGKMNEKHSFMFDPKAMLSVTITCQLFILMLIEDVVEAGYKVLSSNTDGIVILYEESEEEKLKSICSSWEKLTGFDLEDTYYKDYVVRDVNNYFSLKDDNSVKSKGVFEIDKDFHKDNSQRVVSLALIRYFLENIPVEDTINNHLTSEDYTILGNIFKNYGIFDFCKRVRAKGETEYKVIWVDKGELKEEMLSKTTRFYISNRGKGLERIDPPLDKEVEETNQIDIFSVCKPIKVVKKKRKSRGVAKYYMTEFNKKVDGPYDLNLQYYINETSKIIKLFK